MSHGLFASLYESGQPFALIDTRERRDHVDGHWFGSTNIPLSILTDRVGRMVPDHTFPIHLLDWQDAASDAAARRLSELGYSDVNLCPTAHPGQYGNGFVKGEYVWSKAFGEVVAHACGLPEVTPAAYLESQTDLQLFDVRPTSEYREFTIPGSYSLPNSLLLGNMEGLKHTGRTALLHCAGRTRSIIGACTLKAAGHEGPFAIFRGGTQAWQLDGHEREFAADRIFADETGSDAAPRAFLARWKIPVEDIKADECAAFVRRHRDNLLFDVSDDAAKGKSLQHGIMGVSGTNLIQQTDQSIARYHVPVILFDTGSGSRAAFAAYWLQAMGYTVRVALLTATLHEMPGMGSDVSGTETGFAPATLDQLIAHRNMSGRIYDFRSSQAFREAHLAGSEWRNIGEVLSGDPSAQRPDEPIMVIAYDLTHGYETAELLARHDWQVAGVFSWEISDSHKVEIQAGGPADAIDESALFAGRHHGNMQDSRDYLAWEEELPDQIDPMILEVWKRHLGS